MKKSLILLLLIICLCGCQKDKYYLDNNLYESNIIEVTKDEFNNINADSYALLVYMPGCAASAEFSAIVDELSKQDNITFYKITWPEAKETNIHDFLEYYPTVILYEDGKVVDFLESDKDEDMEYYESVSGLESWLSKYIYISKE